MRHTHTLTDPCPLQADGTPYTCPSCTQGIAAGAPVIDFGRHGYVHRVCPSGSTMPARAAGATRPASVPSPVHAAASAPDLGDLVADRIEAMLGITRSIEREHTASRHIAQALAPASAGARDLGDEVADRVEVMLFGAIRGAR